LTFLQCFDAVGFGDRKGIQHIETYAIYPRRFSSGISRGEN